MKHTVTVRIEDVQDLSGIVEEATTSITDAFLLCLTGLAIKQIVVHVVKTKIK